jgi:serine/threonine protein kinase
MTAGDDQATVGFTIPPNLAALTARYELQGEIGRGGMGVVYRARDRQTGDLVALKVIHPSIASDLHAIERFTNELLLARRITHKNVCRVHDLNEFGGVAVISMEFVDGRSLRDLLSQVEAVSIRQGLRIVRQIIGGLAEAHAQGVIHRDLKPENILIGRDGTVRIMDFGIARVADSRRTAIGTIVGTPAYMSPEQAEGLPLDARSDIYSLGLVMYEMFCGRPAFIGDTPVAVVAKQVHETPVAPGELEPDLPHRIEHAILTCLHKKPEKRFQSVAQLEAALSSVAAASASVDDDARPLPDHLARWQRSDWALVAAAVAGLALFVPSFARTSLAPRTQVTFDRSVLPRIAEEYLQRLGVPVTPVTQISGALDPWSYIYLAKLRGAAVARDASNNPVHYWTWHVDFGRTSVEVNSRGRLTAFLRDPVPLDASAPPVDEAKRRASAAVEEFFGVSVSALEFERETRGGAYGFTWIDPPSVGSLRQRYSVSVDRTGVSFLSQTSDLPSGYAYTALDEVTMDRWGLPVAVVFCVLASVFGFFNSRRVVQAAPWRIALAAVSFVGGAAFTLSTLPFGGVGGAVWLAVALGLGLLYAVVTLLGCIALEVLARKDGGHRLATLAALFGSRPGGDAAGLAIVRGGAAGLVVLGVDVFAIWIGTTYFSARLSPVHVGLLGGVLNTLRWPLGVVLAITAVQVAGLGLLVALAASVIARLQSRAWITVVVAAVLLGASGIRVSMGAVQPWQWTLIVLFVDYLLLILTFRRFDLLTLCTAVGTFAFWWANYTLLVMQQPIGAFGPWAAFVVWGLAIAAAAAAAFHATLRRRYRRLAEAFD